MTITLTSESEKAVSERARRQGVAPEYLALLELNRLFLPPSSVTQENSAQTWEMRVKRYQLLVEKDFMVGLTAEEAQECERLGTEIDAAETAAETR